METSLFIKQQIESARQSNNPSKNQLLDALERAVEAIATTPCRCSVSERLSGHLIGCDMLEQQQALADIAVILSGQQDANILGKDEK